jgi:shikimate 5-dehydrogenase
LASIVQSIVCCIGDPVAGNPTQFLMQRAAASHGLDWMFVTAEVPGNRIKEAFEGIRALNFSGAAFLPPHRTAGATLVDSMTESALRSGQVRIARRDGDSWLGEDTLGAAIVELLRFENLVVDDESYIATSGHEWLSHLIRLAAPEPWKTRLVEYRFRNCE